MISGELHIYHQIYTEAQPKQFLNHQGKTRVTKLILGVAYSA